MEKSSKEIDFLFQNSKLQENQRNLKTFLAYVTAKSLSELSSPCAYLSFRPYFIKMTKDIHLDEKRLKNFPKEFWKGRVELSRKSWMNPVRMFEVALMIYFVRDQKIFDTIMLYTVLDVYSTLFKKMFPYCKPEVYEFAMSKISKTHVYVREKGVGGALFFLSNQLSKKYHRSFVDIDKDQISKFIAELRTRIMQSLRSFSTMYYKSISAYKEEEDFTSNSDKITIAAQKVSYQITTIQQIDKQAFKTSLNHTRLPAQLSLMLVKEIHNTKYKNDIELVIKLFFKEVRLKNTNQLCSEKKFFAIYKKQMQVKRLKQLSFKGTLIMLFNKIPVDQKLSNSEKYNCIFMLGLYILNVLRNQLCGHQA